MSRVLTGERVGLRAATRADVEVLAAYEQEPETWRLADADPYVPRTVAWALKQYDGGWSYCSTETRAYFAIEAAGELVGAVNLWGIDLHNRRAHVGISLAPEQRGKGYGSDALRVLLRYAFADRGLHRVQLEVSATNTGAMAAYDRVGFVREGLLREDGWVDGGFVDTVVMAVLATDWAG